MAGIDANTALMIDAEGASITDSSLSPKTITSVGNAAPSATQAKFGSKSVGLDGSGDYLSLADHADWDLFGSTSQDYTIDYFYYMTDYNNLDGMVSQFQDSSNRWQIWVDDNPTGNIEFYAESGGVEQIRLTGSTRTAGAWKHVALVKATSGGVAKWGLYQDGIQTAYAAYSTTFTLAGTLYVGLENNGARDFHGYFDNFRIQKSNYFAVTPNVGLSSTITVPTAAYSVDATGQPTSMRGAFVKGMNRMFGNFVQRCSSGLYVPDRRIFRPNRGLRLA